MEIPHAVTAPATHQPADMDMPKLILLAVSFFVLPSMVTPCFAQQFETTPSKAPTAHEDDWYYQPREQQKPTARQIVQEKAMFRGQQRLARMASLEWYGFSSARPRANPTPFGSMYSNVWAMPGGRPYAWYPTSQPVVILR